MRNYIIITFVAILLSCLTNNINAQQFYGKWVVPTMIGVEMAESANQLSFSSNGISSIPLSGVIPNSDAPCSMSAGGYNADYNSIFYVVSNKLYSNGGNEPWVSYSELGLLPEYQIIARPQNVNDYYSFSAYYAYHDASYIACNIITYDLTSNTASASDIIWSLEFDKGYGGFAISEEDDGSKYLHTVSTERDGYPIGGGIYRWTITPTGISNELTILDQSSSGLQQKQFDAYNVEHKIDDNENNIFAWIHGDSLDYSNQVVSEIVVVIDDDPKIIDLELGRIGGIEFSSSDANIIYASTTNGGIVAVDYTTENGTIVENLNPGSVDYGRTYLQTAPDGEIYAVSNDGTNLGRIIQSGQNAGDFEENVFPFGSPPLSPYVSTYNEFDNLNYYILPENQRVHYEITLSAETTPVCLGGTDGTATVTVEDGYPDYTYQLYDNNGTPIQGPFIITDNEYYFTGLGEGFYMCEVTDNNNHIDEIEFEISVNDMYNVSDNMEEITTFEEPYWKDISSRTYRYGFRISNNTTVTITNSTLKFSEEAKIIIEPGSELILDNSTLTYFEGCNKPWQGIEVWGNSNQSQYVGADGIMYQGKLVVENESQINNAKNAVRTYNPANFNSHGGIIIAENSTFEDNWRSIEIMQYQNFNPYSTDIKLPYINKFKGCTFSTTDNYLFDVEIYTQVSLWDVNGISFFGCGFYNNTTSAQNTGTGILSLNAGYSLLGYCGNNNSQPCNDVITNEFHNLYEGIHASNSGSSTNSPYVNGAEFINNSTGVYISSVNNAVVIKSDFAIGYNTVDGGNCDNVSSFGIDVHNALGFIIENNHFIKLQGAPAGNYVGVRLYETHSEVDEIYNNEFEGLSIGNLSEEYNRPTLANDKPGVVYLCNGNYDNNFDFYVANNSIIRGSMGTDEIPSGNKLSQNAEVQFQNDYTQDIQYYYYDGAPDEVLTSYSNNVYPFGVSTPNPCTDHFNNGGSIKLTSAEKIQKEQDYYQNMVDYNNVVDLFETLKDDGDTPLMENEIETAWPDEMWELRADLLTSSPHLSFEVLVDVANKTNVFPESVQFDIFAANPDEMRNEEFLLYLENKAQPFPEYMIDLLRQVGYGSSYKTVLLNQISMYYTTAIGAAQDIVRSDLFDSITDFNEVRTWLGNIGSYSADKQIISTYLQEDSITLASNLLGTLPDAHSLTGDQLLEYNDYSTLVQLHINLVQQGRNIMQLDSTEIATITDIADYGVGSAVAQAQNMLSMLYGNHYYDCPSLPENLALKRYDESTNSNNDALFIVAKPNPASTWVAFDYELPFYTKKGIIKITDITGKILITIPIVDSIGQKTWDVRNIKSGVYLYILEAGGTTKSGKLIIQ